MLAGQSQNNKTFNNTCYGYNGHEHHRFVKLFREQLQLLCSAQNHLIGDFLFLILSLVYSFNVVLLRNCAVAQQTLFSMCFLKFHAIQKKNRRDLERLV